MYTTETQVQREILHYFHKIENKKKVFPFEATYMENILAGMSQSEVEMIRLEAKKSKITKEIKVERAAVRKKQKTQQQLFLAKKTAYEEAKRNRDITDTQIKVLVERIANLDEVAYRNLREKIMLILQPKSNQNHFESNVSAVQFLITTNLYDVVVDEKFPCIFENMNNAWISVDQRTNKVYYFSEEPNSGQYFYLNVLDFFKIMYDTTFTTAMKLAFNHFHISTNEETWLSEQQEKYAQNISIIEMAEKILRENYPNLFKVAKKHLCVLEKMQHIGLSNLCRQEYQIDGEATFFASYGYIAELSRKSKTATANSVNLLATLNLIQKVPENMIPETLRQNAIHEAAAKGQDNLVTFWVAVELNSITLSKAEERAQILRKHKIAARDISLATVQRVFGEEIGHSVYGNTKENIEIKRYLCDYNKRSDYYLN